ncbi:hypothetical protein ACFPES_28830 [Paenibacillus sp. GCM10023248]|uniref:hypothetical protein n=1 Tax=unclassified Paenibacillus TaxID=185978 RepID=UPI002377F685|nr:hypothetical protein [Paenibacillus sp. MAHUQ-63]MDD9271059.1 hypothetical protein [Paenibacillus sp. MAHUQ-63]
MRRRYVGAAWAAVLVSLMAGCMDDRAVNGNAGGSPSASGSPAGTISPAPSTAPTVSAPPVKKPNPVTAEPAATAQPTKQPVPTSYAKEADAKKAIEQRAQDTVQALKDHDMSKLAKLVHPKKGVQFSPYSHIDTTHDVRVQGSGLDALWTDTNTTHWGTLDGSGDPIDLTFPDYWNKFVYNQDFAAAPQTSYNTILGKGNMVNNVFSIYPVASFITVEYHFPGIDPQFQGMDWTSLRLVYENSGGQWYLVAVVHDQHTM